MTEIDFIHSILDWIFFFFENLKQFLIYILNHFWFYLINLDYPSFLIWIIPSCKLIKLFFSNSNQNNFLVSHTSFKQHNIDTLLLLIILFLIIVIQEGFPLTILINWSHVNRSPCLLVLLECFGPIEPKLLIQLPTDNTIVITFKLYTMLL